MSLDHRVPFAHPTWALVIVAGLLLAGCATQPYSQLIATGSASPAASASGTATSGTSASATPSVLLPSATTSGVGEFKLARTFTLPSTVNGYNLSTDPQLPGVYQRTGNPTDIYTAQVTAVTVDAGELAKALFPTSMKQLSGSYCGQAKAQPAVCIRQLAGGYLQVTGSGAKTLADVATFTDALYKAS